ncbi:MAG TPA: hypothetical protein VK563_06200 [Puia sp.]|nr:hypothetical protein [Puia sp.]
MKIALGISIGVFSTLAIFLWFRVFINPKYTLSIPQFITDTSRKRLAQEDIISLKNQSLGFEEKIASANKRLDDMLIFGGIIVTLLLAINVAVYVNSERQVDKYFRDNFEIHKQKVLKYTTEAEEMAGKIKAELELWQNLRKQQTQTVQTPQ